MRNLRIFAIAALACTALSTPAFATEHIDPGRSVNNLDSNNISADNRATTLVGALNTQPMSNDSPTATRPEVRMLPAGSLSASNGMYTLGADRLNSNGNAGGALT